MESEEVIAVNLRRMVKGLALLTFVSVLAGTGLFFFNATHAYTIQSGFAAVPLDYDPDAHVSRISWQDAALVVHDGFVKGIQQDRTGESLVIRALAPDPVIEITNAGASARDWSITLENISPDSYAANLDQALAPARVAVNALEFQIQLAAGASGSIRSSLSTAASDQPIVILGDNRNGYDTFATIITQVNAIKPAFVIDNGDLVFSGKPNQYRLFDQMISGIATTVNTTLGNHDIRGNGRDIYTKLYGPAYYSFDWGDTHYVFLDSSRGYAEPEAIPADQYAWLERDLQQARGKQLVVISHVPPTDPRPGLKPNDIEAYTDQLKQEGGLIERKLEAYSVDAAIDHGFRTSSEAEKFEALMAQYQVSTVYLSHIHSYFDYTKQGVRYLISGGAGAELMTQGSYYHYLVIHPDQPNLLTQVQLPSPGNQILKRYGATLLLFAKAMYKENKAAVIFMLTGLGFLVLLLLLLLYLKLEDRLARLWSVLKDTGHFLADRYRAK